ncbi:MAG: CopD family protein [Gammaproteobacteria bacterium]
MYIGIKFLHIAFFAVWFAGLTALPWIFGEHVQQQTGRGMSPLRRIERTVYFGVTTPAGVLAVLFGTALMFYGFDGAWLHVKLTLIVVAVLFHLYCGQLLRAFLHGGVKRGRFYFRALSQLPLLLLIAIVFLASAKPL